MYAVIFRKKYILLCFGAVILLAFAAGLLCAALPAEQVNADEQKKDFIKWVDFSVPYEALDRAMRADIAAHEKGKKASWIEILAYCAAKHTGGKDSFPSEDIDFAAQQLEQGKKMSELAANYRSYDYYYEAYSAVLSNLLGEYEIEIPDKNVSGGKKWVKKYGLKGFSPIAKNYYYSESDDFGNSRTYGFKRKHLGHDMMGSLGTPIIAVESGVVETMGWNQYGGWRIGIRSFDTKRYYYYAHLRKGHPYPPDLKEGCVVKAGDVIGYMGLTGYSTHEDINNMNVTHLHFGLQLIFDKSQEDGNGEIWIDVYPLVKLLSKNKSETVRIKDSKDYRRAYDIRDPSIAEWGYKEEPSS